MCVRSSGMVCIMSKRVGAPLPLPGSAGLACAGGSSSSAPLLVAPRPRGRPPNASALDGGAGRKRKVRVAELPPGVEYVPYISKALPWPERSVEGLDAYVEKLKMLEEAAEGIYCPDAFSGGEIPARGTPYASSRALDTLLHTPMPRLALYPAAQCAVESRDTGPRPSAARESLNLAWRARRRCDCEARSASAHSELIFA